MAITIDDLGITKEELTDRVVEACAEQILNETGWNPEDEVEVKVPSSLARKMKERIEQLITDSVNRQLHTAVKDRIAETFANAYYDTDFYGTPRPGSKQRTMPEIVLEQVHKWLQQRVNSQGHESNYGADKPRITWMISQEVDKTIKEVLAPEIEVAKKNMHAQLAGKLSQAFTDALKKLAPF